ncbi:MULTISPECIES: Fic family protein [unclassified Imperialibacter]|uniref:Fic family protein n=1 Tax=unclassified Imperialibacter TaxID=2629706 RepID=UPI00125BAE03|nr:MULTISPECIES: Fic/DOC family N-terminal domain-containing protein [unclassified Imperialibacter]CAD5254283.1 Protein adenylyltransferase SoFic [Imperialibacter sp. 75]CAD5262721.1 Protein adenylyltransferase SoFic [Imperialibacter sp. 89]VVT35299.1 Adenosine monophosphate-protein transferase SoFic [Imperialibacter sp. EC-SDR9]
MPEILYPINPDRSVPWNDIPSLPIRKELHHTIEVLEKLGDAKAALARLHGRSAIIPNQGLLINTISLQEAKISSAIENIFTTDDELYKAFSDQNTESTGASKEVLRYREALWSGHHYLKKTGQFNQEYFIQGFQVIKQTREGIRPDFLNTTIRQGGSGPNAGQVIYTPPRGIAAIKDKLDNLVNFLNNDEKYRIDDILKMAIAHFQFEAIHPFRDGNGRTGRLFNIHYLTNKGLLDVPILFLSRYILDHKEDYYAGLMGVSQRANWTDWLLFMMRAVEHTSNLTFHKINEIMSARDSILEFVKRGDRKFRSPEGLVELLFSQPFTKVKHLVEAGLYAENTARDYLNRLCEMEVMEKKEIEGHHYYLNIELYRILSA